MTETNIYTTDETDELRAKLEIADRIIANLQSENRRLYREKYASMAFNITAFAVGIVGGIAGFAGLVKLVGG